MSDPLAAAVELARFLGNPDLDCAILAEGNVSTRADEDSFWVKASGFEMASITSSGFVKVAFQPILAALDRGSASDSAVRDILALSRLDETTLMPSVETFMHAYLLTLPKVSFVGHGHPTALVSLLSLTTAPQLAKKRLFPDEVVCCGPAAAFIPYTDPGLPLAMAIIRSVEEYVDEFGSVPRTIWMANHGLIALGENPAEVRNATAMAIKSARAWLGALGTGQEIRPLTQQQIERIHSRPDEHYRQRLLKEMRASVTV